MLSTGGNFKDAVFIVENTYFNGELDKEKFNKSIAYLSEIINRWKEVNKLSNYHFSDSMNFHTNYAIFHLLKDSVKARSVKGTQYISLPYKYDFDDFFANRDWSKMFVSKLIASHTGNCHSFPYLYKILADELRASCWLSLAPNHIYIKNRCKKSGWYNTELTSGSFPIDAWVMASGYIPLEAVQNGIYMDTLSNQQAIALCVLDLAKGYERQMRNYYDGFIIQCCDLVLKYHPNNVMAILLKAETMKKLYLKEQADKYPKLTYTPIQMGKLYGQLFDLGYREMPEKMYMKWLQSVKAEKAKFANKQLKGF